MTFWGVEVKPNKPFTVDCEELGGKLILTQATLGVGSSTKKCILKCNVGEKSPVFLCTLLPEKSESCSLNLEFDEEDNVEFSVVGPTSIHLAGFVQEDPQDSDDDGCCEHGACAEDISGTESEESNDNSEESSDHDFIDDDDMTMDPPSHVRNSKVVLEEIDDEKASGEIGSSKKSKKKKNQLADTKNDQKALVVKENTGASVLESEDEDGFPVSQKSKPSSENGNTKAEDAKRKNNKKKNAAKDENEDDKSLKRKIDAVDHDEEPKSDTAVDKKKKQKQKANSDDGEADANTKKVVKEAKKTPTTEAKQSKAKQPKVRTYSNGLVIEELQMGKPDGKRASKGRKVSVRYIGKLQKNGKQFDSNIGRAPFKFRLGVGQVIKGWDVGVEGMRVGDKRKLTIPPSMGYGSNGAPPQIPPNAWLVFDVELVDAA